MTETPTLETSPPQDTEAENNTQHTGAQSLRTIAGDDIMKVTAGLPEEQRDAIRWLYALAKEKEWNLRDLEREIKFSSSALYRVFKGTYGAKLDGIVERIVSYRKLTDERSSTARPSFVETSIARKVFKACEWALVSQSMTFIYGNSQIGKTTALEEYARTHNHGQTKIVRMPASAGVQLFMKEMAKACYLSPDSCFDNLRQRVLNAIDHTNLVIIDELHQVFLSYQKGSAIKCLEVIREIHDRTKCGMVLCGTTRLRKELMLGQHVELLEQFKRRGVLELNLPPRPPKKDLTAIIETFDLPEPEGDAADLRDNILRDHGLGKFVKFLQAASRVASKQKERLNWNHFIRTHDILMKLSEGFKDEEGSR